MGLGVEQGGFLLSQCLEASPPLKKYQNVTLLSPEIKTHKAASPARLTTYLALYSWPGEATGINISLLQNADHSFGPTTNQVTLSNTFQLPEPQDLIYKGLVLICILFGDTGFTR